MCVWGGGVARAKCECHDLCICRDLFLFCGALVFDECVFCVCAYGAGLEISDPRQRWHSHTENSEA